MHTHTSQRAQPWQRMSAKRTAAAVTMASAEEESSTTSGAGTENTDDAGCNFDNLRAFYTLSHRDSDGKNLTFLCKLCPPALKKQVRTSMTSFSNLKRHVELKHSSSVKAYMQALQGHRGKGKTPSQSPQTTQVTLPAAFRGIISQQQVDRLIINYIVGDLQPLSKVEKPSFIKLVTGLQPGRHVPSRRQVQGLLNKEFIEVINNLKAELAELDFVCTTADCWSAVNKGFMGITIHWLDKNDVSLRRSAALACRRVRGSHTYDVLTKVLTDVYKEFKIQNKIVCTVTDNASNFVKAFSCFGDSVVIRAADEVTEGSDTGSTPAESSDDEDDGLEPSPLSELEDPCLPPHRRCMAHTLNLVATDAKNVTDRLYNKLARPVFSKASALWNRVKRSAKASDFVEEKLKICFVTPNDTRWNSMFLSMQRLAHIATLTPQTSNLTVPLDATPEYDRLLLHTICDEFGLRRFTPEEIDFINKFVSVMGPLACALNILQGEKNTFLGYLAPTIVQLKNDLDGLLDESSKPTATQGLTACRPLIQTLMQSLSRRLEGCLENKDHILAAILLPVFKLDWVEDQSKRVQYRLMLREELRSVNVPESEQPPDDLEGKKSASSFFKFKQSPSAVNKSEVDIYLNAPTTDEFTEYMLLPKLKKLFIKYNTAIPSSAPVERLFSTGGQIFRPRRNRLGDANFEKQLLLNVNKKQFGLKP